MRCCPIGSSFPKRPARAFTSAPIRNRRYSPFTSLQSSVARNPTRHCEIVKIAYLPINVAQNGFDRSLFHIFPLPRFDAALPDCYYQIAGWSSLVARWAHNPKVASSNLAPATKPSLILNGFRELPGGRFTVWWQLRQILGKEFRRFLVQKYTKLLSDLHIVGCKESHHNRRHSGIPGELPYASPSTNKGTPVLARSQLSLPVVLVMS